MDPRTFELADLERISIRELLELWTRYPEFRQRVHVLEKDHARRLGGRARAKVHAERHAWMRPVFERAYAELQAERPTRIGWRRLEVVAHRIARDDPRRGDINEYQARTYLKTRR